jgi:hypothetical protein
MMPKAKPVTPEKAPKQMKACPFCAEQIKSGARTGQSH